MMECDLVAGFTGFPNYLVTVWNWRTQQRLLALPTGVLKRKQIYMPSQTHMLLCECWGEGLIVWEVAQCYKRCFMMKRAKEEVTGWEISDPALVGVCWTNDGHLYAIDSLANLYSVISDGIGMITNLEWSEDLQGAEKPSICSFFNGILIYGPDQKLRLLKKWDSTWKVVWSFEPDDSVVRLISNATYELAAMWTARGFLYKLVGETEEKIDVVLYTYRQRNIVKIQLIAPDFKHLATMNKTGELCFYEALSGKLVLRKLVEGNDINFQGSPVDPLLVIFGEVGQNYGIGLFTYEPGLGLQKVGSMCLTHQIVSQVVFSSTGRKLVAVAKSAGHIFIFELSEKYKLTLVRYAELGRGLADSFLMKVGEAMRSFNLILFSDKYFIGERIVCINADSGKDNKFAGKMQGPYSEVVPLAARDCALAVPHLSTHMHVLRLSGVKGKTVSVKMGPVFESGHDLKQFRAFCNGNALLTFGYDGAVILRKPDAPEKYDLKLIVSHRYESGVEQALIDSNSRYIVHVGGNGTTAVTVINNKHEGVLTELSTDIRTEAPDPNLFEDSAVNIITIFNESEKNYLDVVEDKRVREETLEFARQRAEVSRGLEAIQERVVALLESNLAAPPLHRLPLSSFNLHVERTNERAEEEREQIRLQTEARIRAQDTVTAWIKSQCWDSMITPRIKLFSIFSHYHVENFAVLPNQREVWPELQLTEALRTLEMENDADVFRPWEEHTPTPAVEHNQM
ncbi:unnamed protein product [Parnassius apollo]|uniref:(apollo) hypothetical protein n=1 Tax=Parnassius apollo TaxID=110799 RepID=A0A8S3WTR4_PARAO|nr:unnamed protein product [Parnassius apollo]